MFKRKPIRSFTYLSATTEIQGTLNVEGDLRVDGIVHGIVEVRGDLEISKTGLIEGAQLKAKNIVSHGVIKAKVIAEGQLTLTHTARLEGDVSAHAIDIEAGALYVGHIDTQNSESAVKVLPMPNHYPKLVGQED